MALRLLHTADSHIGADLPVRAGGLCRRRGGDFVASYRHVLAQAEAWQVDGVIHAGDLFDRSQPRAGAVAAATEPLWQVAQAGIPVIIVPGNHERSALPDALLLAHANIHVLRAPGTVVLERGGLRLAIAGFPCLRRGAAGHFAAAVEATGWRRARADVNVLAVHQTFAGARCGPANFQFRTGDAVVPRAGVPAGFDYIAAGHIHRHQVLPGEGTPLVYAGSPDRITFAEMGEPKGCVLVEFAGGRAGPRFVEHAVRPMQIVPLDVSGLSGAEVVARLLEAIGEAPADAVVQVRFSGQATRPTLGGLQLGPRMRAARPDLTASISAQAVEWVPERVVFRAASRTQRSAFEVLDAPAAAPVKCGAAESGAVPAVCGTYALYDAEDRLLYVGKGLNVRARVRSHLRGSSSNHFRGWARHVARVEVRPAGSELEALLVEAELIRRLAPPFNRQMRLWQRYCYLCRGRRAYAQLEIRPEPIRGRVVFGPLRSRAGAEEALEALNAYLGLAHCPEESTERQQGLLPAVSAARRCGRYFAGQCLGPCGGGGEQVEHAARLAVRDRLLSGDGTRVLAAIQQELGESAEGGGGAANGPAAERERMLRSLVALHERAALLREARRLLGRALLLPAGDGQRIVALIDHKGLHLANWPDGARGLQQTAGAGRERRGKSPEAVYNALPKPVADCLCTAVRYLRRNPGGCVELAGLAGHS